jgi:transposase
MRPHGSPAELEKRRWRAIDLLKSGLSITAVARHVRSSHSSVILWRDTLRRRGRSGLKAKPIPGRPTKLGSKQIRKLPALLLRGALTWGYSTDLWTTSRIAAVIEREFRVRFHRAHVGRLLADLGWSCQKPERRALERDEEAIERWKRYRWTAIKKKSRG